MNIRSSSRLYKFLGLFVYLQERYRGTKIPKMSDLRNPDNNECCCALVMGQRRLD